MLLSLSAWTPEHRGRGSEFAWPIGTEATLRWGDDPANTVPVRIESDRFIEQLGEPRAKFVVFEVVFLESVRTPDVVYEQGRRYAVPADKLEPNVAVLRQHREIAALIKGANT